MASARPAVMTCPICRQPVELPTRLTSERGRPVATLAVDLQPATDHALTHTEATWTSANDTPAPGS